MKKMWRVMTVAALATALLGGCASSGSTAATSAAESSQTEASKETAAETMESAAETVAESAPENGKVQSGTVSYEIDMSEVAEGKAVRVWLPIPSDGEEQTISDVKMDLGELQGDALGNRMLYAEWGTDVKPEERKLTASFHVVRKEALRPELVESGEPDDSLKEYLGETEMVKTGGVVKEQADEIVKGETTYLGKTRAIYDWIIENMNRDEAVLGCGQGDVCTLLDTKAGKCTDINSVFVALCRAAGIPAREMFGIRINADDITGNQHCWAQFYLPGTGWVYADPADVLKAVLKNQWEKDSAETKELQEYYWGNVDEKRVELSQGRDLILAPAQEGAALNDFGYPYAEVDGEPVDFYVPQKFKYSIHFREDAKDSAETQAQPMVSAQDVKEVAMQYVEDDTLAAGLENYLILDLRKAEDYAAGHIPGAVNADLDATVSGGDVEHSLKALLPYAAEGKDIALVCYSGKRYAQAGTNALAALGADMGQVYTLKGGFKQWSKDHSDLVEK